MATKKKVEREDALVERIATLVAAGHLERGDASSATDIAAVEAAEGRPLPPVYVKIMERVGGLGRWTHKKADGTYFSRDHTKIYAPTVALALTTHLRKAHGTGRLAKVLGRTFFFAHWRKVNAIHGVDDEGHVRVLHLARPGTVLKIEAHNLTTTLSNLIAEVEEDVRDETEIDRKSLEVSSATELTPERIAELGGLERLTVARADGLEVIEELKELRELQIRAKSPELPDAVFRAPKLTKIVFRGTTRYGAGLDPLLRWMQNARIAPAKRALYVRLLVNDEAWLAKHASVDDLLEALDAESAKVTDAALQCLAAKVKPPKTLEGARVAILGRTKAKLATLTSQLEGAGASVVPPAQATLALIGAGPKGAWRDVAKIPRVLEAHLGELLDAKGARTLAADAKQDPSMVSRLRELLLSADAANVELALGMMKEGGVPLGDGVSNGILEPMALLVQDRDRPAKQRTAAEKLLSASAPDVLSAVKKAWAGSSLSQANRLKSTDRLKEVDGAGKKRFSSKRFALDFAERGDKRGYDVIGLFALETGDEEYIAEVLEGALRAGGLRLNLGPGAGERLIEAMTRSRALAAMAPRIERLDLGQGMKSVPDVVGTMRGLRELSLARNDLTTLPAALAKLDKLEVLDVSENRFAEFPAVIGELRALRELRACAAERGPSLTELPEAIGDLRNLEVLELFNHKLTALPASIAKLTKLRELRISSTRIAELPESIATLPSLEEVWLPSTATNAAALATALKKRNVKVA